MFAAAYDAAAASRTATTLAASVNGPEAGLPMRNSAPITRATIQTRILKVSALTPLRRSTTYRLSSPNRDCTTQSLGFETPTLPLRQVSQMIIRCGKRLGALHRSCGSSCAILDRYYRSRRTRAPEWSTQGLHASCLATELLRRFCHQTCRA